jgi:predicted dehydrogenase
MSELDGIRLGVVGVGYWGSKHVRVLRSTAGVASVVGIDVRYEGIGDGPQHADRDLVGYANIEEALPHVDALVIATPPSSHARLGMQAIAAGKHALVEKPLATTTAQARLLVQAAEAAGVVLMPGHTLEHNAAVHKLRDMVQSRALGQLYYLDFARLNLGLYQPDVGVIMDLAPHDISISNFVLGSRPTAVTAYGARHVHDKYEDIAHLILDYADISVRTYIHVSWLSPQKVRRVTVVGSKQMAVYDDLNADERIRVYDKAAVRSGESDELSSKVAYHFGGILSPFVPFAEPLAVQDQHFIDCITSGSHPTTDGNSGLTVVQVLECAEISLSQGRTVPLSEVASPQEAITLGSLGENIPHARHDPADVVIR